MDHTVRGLNGLCFAVQLIAEAFDIVHAIGNYNDIRRQNSFDGRRKSCSGVLLRTCSSVDIASQAKAFVIDMLDFETLDSGLFGVGYFSGEKIDELTAAEGLATGRVARDEEELATAWLLACADLYSHVVRYPFIEYRVMHHIPASRPSGPRHELFGARGRRYE